MCDFYLLLFKRMKRQSSFETAMVWEVWFKREFIQDKIKIQVIVMGSSTSVLPIDGELIYTQLRKKRKKRKKK